MTKGIIEWKNSCADKVVWMCLCMCGGYAENKSMCKICVETRRCEGIIDVQR